MWWNILNSLDWKFGLALFTVIVEFILAVIGFITVIKWIF